MFTLYLKRLLLSFSLLLFLVPSLNAQDISKLKIKGNYNDQLLQLVLLDLKIKYRLNIEFNEEVGKDIKITATFGKIPLPEALNTILSGTKLDFKIEEPRTVTIYEKIEEQRDLAIHKPSKYDFTITGVVKDKKSGESLPFATVIIKGKNNGATTNVDGYFTLFNVPSDTAVIEVQYLGYQTKRIRLKPNMDFEDLKIFLEDFSHEIEEIIVLAEKEEQLLEASTGISKIGFTPATLAALPSFGEKDIFRSLQLLPGVSGTNESSAGLYIRGGTPDQNLVLFDDFTVYHVDHLFGFFSAFNTNAIKDVQLYKGGFDAKYGGRISSVVDLTGKDGNSEQFNMGLGLSLLSVNGFVESPFADGKGTFLIAGRRSFQSNFYNNLFDAFTKDTGNNETQGAGGGRRFAQQQVQPNSYFYDLNAKLTYRFSPKDVVSLSFYNGQDILDNSRITDSNSLGGKFGSGNSNFSFSSDNIDLTNWGNWGASGKWGRKWSDRFYSKAIVSFSNYFSERDRSNETTITRTDSTTIRKNGSYENNDLKDITFKWDNEWKISGSNQLEFGLQSTYNDIKYQFVQNDTSILLDRVDQGLIASLYVQDKHTFFDKLILKGGLRASYYDVSENVYYEPRASLTYLLSNKFKLKAAWGQYYQFATRIVREDIQQGSRDFWLLSNDENVPVSYSEHFIGGASYETPSFLFDVEAYYKKLGGLSEYTTRFTTTGFGPDRTLDYEELFYSGIGYAKGIEFLAQKKVGKFTGWLGYTLGEVKYDFDAFGDEPFYANQDQTHEFKAVELFKYKKWDFGATFVYATGKPYTAPTSFYELTLLDGSTASFFEVSDKNALRLPDYHRFDISATYNFNMGNSKANLGLSIFNVYNRQNVWYKEYEVIEGELIETDVSLLNITPSLFFTWKLR